MNETSQELINWQRQDLPLTGQKQSQTVKHEPGKQSQRIYNIMNV